MPPPTSTASPEAREQARRPSGLYVLAAVEPVGAHRVAVELVVEVGLAPRVAGERGAGGRLEAVAAGGGDAVRRARAEAARRQQELDPAVGVLLGGGLLLPGAAGARLEDRLAALVGRARRSRRRRRRPRRWTAGSAPGWAIGAARSPRRSARRCGRTGGRRTRRAATSTSDDQRDGQLGSCRSWGWWHSESVDRGSSLSGGHRLDQDRRSRRADGETLRGTPASLAQGPRVGSNPPGAPCVPVLDWAATACGRVVRRQPTCTPSSGPSVASSSCLTSRNAQTTAEPASIRNTPTRKAAVAPWVNEPR